jgi:xylulokinase
VNDEAGATGAAIQACWCYATETAGEKVSIVEITNKFIQLDDTTRSDPSAAAVKVYNEVYKNFTAVNRILEPNYTLICMKNLS